MIRLIIAFLVGIGMMSMPAWTNELNIAYPHPYTLFQRDSATGGVVKIRGTFPADKHPEKIEARLGNNAWQVVDAQPGSGVFAGTIPAPVGQGLLEVRAIGCGGLTASVECVGVGDLFLITGQSNADGRGREWVRLDPSNPYVGVKYCHNAWSKGDDPSANDTTNINDSASPWPIALNRLIPDQNVPMGFIAAAMGSTVVKQWQNRAVGGATDNIWRPGGMYWRALQMVKTATDGSMKIRAVLYYQGENDLTHHNTMSVLGDYTEYKTNLMVAVSDLWETFKAPVLVGQITNLGAERQKNDNIRRAQQEVWKEHPHALPGAVTYDIFPTDGCHYREATNMKAYSDRWSAAILCGIYGRREMAGPELIGFRRGEEKQLVFIYNQPMALKSWDGRTGTNADGFRFLEGDQVLTNMQVVATKIDGKEVIVALNRNPPARLRVDYGSGADGQGKVTLRSAATGLPAPMMFGLPLK